MLANRQLRFSLSALSLLGLLPGCLGEDGLKDGITEGLSAAVAALIEAPVAEWIEDHYAADE